ncbi:hypothetical protein VZQ01_37245 [Myxococcus faecalis]|uniref:hypothetical protein n=1 Tax=Myxococcus faecalis TaxID=3115646 RepID=UPI003CE6C014
MSPEPKRMAVFLDDMDTAFQVRADGLKAKNSHRPARRPVIGSGRNAFGGLTQLSKSGLTG